MPGFPIIDGHVHLYDPTCIAFPWLSQVPAINRAFLYEDYKKAYEDVCVEKLVFIEVDARPDQNIAEIEWLEGQLANNPVIAGAVAAVPLEDASRTRHDLNVLGQKSIVKGVRRITQLEHDGFCTRASFIDAVRLLGERGYVCDLCIRANQIEDHVKLVEACPETQFVLDHLGKPAIHSGEIGSWRADIARIAKFPNVAAKISGLVTEAGPVWTQDNIRPVVDAAVEHFGFDRLIYGSDWPVISLASVTPRRWIEILDHVLSGVSAVDMNAFYRGNALKIYRL